MVGSLFQVMEGNVTLLQDMKNCKSQQKYFGYLSTDSKPRVTSFLTKDKAERIFSLCKTIIIVGNKSCQRKIN